MRGVITERYLKALRGMGLDVHGETITEINEQIEALRQQSAYIPSEAQELVEQYRKFGGPRRTPKPLPRDLEAIRDVEGLRRYIYRINGIKVGSTLDEIAAAIRNRPTRFKSAQHLRAKIRQLRPVEAAAMKAELEEAKERERAMAELAETRPPALPYFIRNYSFAFNRIYWAPAFPDARFDVRTTPYLMRDYRSATVQDGAAIDLGPLLPGDIILAIADRQTGIGSVAHLPFVADEAAVMGVIRNREINERSALSGVSAYIGDPLQARIDRANGIASPYDYELARLVREQAKLVPDNAKADLVAALVMAGVGVRDNQATAPGMVELLIGAAYVAGISVVDIAILPPQALPEEGASLLFDNGRKAVVKNGTAVATLDGKRKHGERVISFLERIAARLDAIVPEGRAREIIDNELIPIAIGLWGRDAGALKERFDVLLARLEKLSPKEREKVVAARVLEWGKIVADQQPRFTGVVDAPAAAAPEGLVADAPAPEATEGVAGPETPAGGVIAPVSAATLPTR